MFEKSREGFHVMGRYDLAMGRYDLAIPPMTLSKDIYLVTILPILWYFNLPIPF